MNKAQYSAIYDYHKSFMLCYSLRERLAKAEAELAKAGDKLIEQGAWLTTTTDSSG